jgi:hypothetical protein
MAMRQWPHQLLPQLAWVVVMPHHLPLLAALQKLCRTPVPPLHRSQLID